MAEEGKAGPGGNVIVVKKKARHPAHPHHGGAWKVAYADFVTAMMAFFLLLWLLATTTEEQKTGIAHYFNPPSNASQYGGGQGIMGGSSVVDTQKNAPSESPLVLPVAKTDEDLAVQAKEDAMFRQVAEELKKAVMNIPELKAMLDNLLIDVTPEGLRISVTDSQGRPLFKGNTAELEDHTTAMLGVVAAVLGPLRNDLAIGGHTDVVPYRGERPRYTNWELSGERAQAARRVLTEEGIPEKRIGRVAGYASKEPLLPDQPEAVRNRRLTIIVLRSNRGTTAQFTQDGLVAPPAAPAGPPKGPEGPVLE